MTTRPIGDPTGDRRADLLARLELGLGPTPVDPPRYCARCGAGDRAHLALPCPGGVTS